MKKMFCIKRSKKECKKESVIDVANRNAKMEAALFLMENNMQEQGVKLIKEINDNS